MKHGENIVVIDGKDYCKCHVPEKQWNDCLTPCVFCDSAIQMQCTNIGSNHCYGGDEHVCYKKFEDILEI